MAEPTLVECSSEEDASKKSTNLNRSRAAQLREQRKRINKARPSTLQRLSGEPIDTSRLNIDQKIDAVKATLAENGLSMVQFVSEACSCDYEARRTGRTPGSYLTLQDLEDAEAVRRWAKEIAIQQIVQEASDMQAKNPLCPKSEFLHISHRVRPHISNVDDAGSTAWLKSWSPSFAYTHLAKKMPFFITILNAFLGTEKDPANSTEQNRNMASPML